MDHCRSLPLVTEDVKWADHHVFSVASKMFAMFDVDERSTRFRFKCDDEDFDALCERAEIEPSSHIGRYGWVNIERADVLPMDEAKALLTKSHRLVVGGLSKKKQREILGESLDVH